MKTVTLFRSQVISDSVCSYWLLYKGRSALMSPQLVKAWYNGGQPWRKSCSSSFSNNCKQKQSNSKKRKRSCFLRSLMLQLAWFPDVAYPSFNFKSVKKTFYALYSRKYLEIVEEYPWGSMFFNRWHEGRGQKLILRKFSFTLSQCTRDLRVQKPSQAEIINFTVYAQWSFQLFFGLMDSLTFSKQTHSEVNRW